MDKIIYADKEEFNKKLAAIKNSGKDNLHIVSDFDRTLTKVQHNGIKTQNSFFGLREGNYFGENFLKRDIELYDKFYPVEISIEYSHDDKFSAMQEWWEEYYDMVLDYDLTQDIIKDIAKNGKMHLRDNGETFFKILSDNNIPILILSAGIGNVIEEYLKVKNLVTDNVHIISNFYTFDENGKANGYNKPLIHTMNKSEVIIRNYPYHEEVENKKNIILLGDNINDVDMSEGMHHDNIIKIGFTYDKTEMVIDEFLNVYDVLITQDGDLDFVNELLKEIID